MPDSLGKLVKKLRAERSLSQEALAAAAGVARDTIGAVEQGRDRRWYPDTAHRIFKILMQVAPLGQAQAYQLLDAMGLSRGLFHTTLEDQELERSRRASAGAPMVATSIQADTEARVLLDQLKATVGSEKAVILLRGLLATETALRAAGHAVLNVRHPPGPSNLVPGAVEQRVTHYEQTEPEHQEAPRNPRARKID